MFIREFLLFLAVYFLAMFIQHVCGFGMGIVAIILLPYLVGSHTVPAACTNILSAVSASYLAFRFRENVRWRLVVPVFCGSFFATFLTIRLSAGASFAMLEKVLGTVLILLAVYFLFFRGKITIRPLFRNGLLAGLMGGFLNGLFGAGGPPVVLFLLGTTENQAVYLATIQGYFAINNIYTTTVRLFSGQLNTGILPGLSGAFVGMIFGILLGDRLAKYISEKVMLRMIYILMAISGFTMLF